MSVPAAYVGVILIWTTTPLAIQWSAHGSGFLFGVALRMSISLILLLGIIRLLRMPFPWDVHARRVYLVSGLTLYFVMTAVYWSAQYIPSGWISVIFGLTPIVTGVFAALLLGEAAFSGGRLAGMLLGLVGLLLVFTESLDLRASAWLGVIGILFGAVTHSLGAVVLKRLGPSMSALSLTTGTLVVAVPLFLISLFWAHGLPDMVSQRTLMAILYLAVFGSVLGFSMYYYILKQLDTGRVALITLITPVTALLLGMAFNGEAVSPQVWAGTVLILAGLGLHEYGVMLGRVRRRYARNIG